VSKESQLDLGIEVPDKLYFRIGEVAELVGVESHVLRYWESEFRMRPQRSGSGQRMYQKKDIARFLRVRQLLHDEGFTIAGARNVLSGKTDEPARVDTDAIRAATERIGALRDRISAARDRFAKLLVLPEPPASD